MTRWILAVALVVGCADRPAVPAPDWTAGSNTDVTGPTVDGGNAARVCFEVTVEPDGSPIGELSIEQSIAGRDFYPAVITTSGTNYAASGVRGALVADPEKRAVVNLCVERPMPKVRLRYSRDRGGAADAIRVRTVGPIHSACDRGVCGRRADGSCDRTGWCGSCHCTDDVEAGGAR